MESADRVAGQRWTDCGGDFGGSGQEPAHGVIKFPDIPAAQQNPFGPPSPSHGIGITSDQKILVANSRQNTALYKYSLPDLQLLGTAPLGGKGAEWLTITPDDKTVYVANPETNNVSVVDIATMKETAVIPVGFAQG